MSNSLYDISISSYIQILSGMTRVLAKGADYAKETNRNPDEYVGISLHEDMLPFLFQVNSVMHHSLGVLSALEEGVFSPQKSITPLNYSELQTLANDTLEELKGISADTINSHQGKPMMFKMGDLEIPFTAENFILSFSLPNLNFHATTAYDILRAEGVPLTKADYLGKMRVGN